MTPAKVLSPRPAALERIKALVLDTLPSPESNGRTRRRSMISSVGAMTRLLANSPRRL